MMQKDPLLGGMALIEGVMMRGPTKIGMAVRNPSGSIVTKSYPFVPLTQRWHVSKVPFIRGVLGMAEMLYIGYTALNYSSKVALDEEIEEAAEVFLTTLSVILGLAFALVLFKFVPFGATVGISALFPVLHNTWLFNVTEGIIKLLIFVGYIYVISLMPDIFRVFQYHGAEHKAVWCKELKKPLTVANVRTCSRFHPRCGTSFIVFIILLSIIVYAFIPSSMGFWAKFSWRILLLPVIAGVSYEILRISARYQHSLLFKAISTPGLWVQRLTTKEPDEQQIKVSITALKQVI